MTKRKTVSTTPATLIGLTHAQAFAQVEAEIDAVPDAALIPIITDITQSAETAFVAADRLDTLMSELATLPTAHFAFEKARKLRLYTGALLYTHVLAMAPKGETELKAMLQEAIPLRHKLLVMAEALGELGLVSSEHVAAIRSGHGHHDTANDLTALASLYEGSWGRLGSQVPITRAEVDRAAVLGTRLIAALGDRRYEADALEHTKDARRTRARAYALFMDVYDTCQQGVWFLRWKQGDVDRYVPSIHPRRPRRPRSEESEVVSDAGGVVEPAAADELEPSPPQVVEPADELGSE
jgi:hypothetical protein